MPQNLLLKMGGPDSFYTPVYLAEQMVRYALKQEVRTIADFCVGDGRLLDAARQCFPKARLFGMDIDQEIIRKLSDKHNDWVLKVCDFIDDEEVNKIVQNKFDLILLNPPFSCKGSIINIVECDGITFKVSTAMMFILKAIRFLSEKGDMYAILPVSCVYSQKDRKAWNYLKKQYNAHVLEERNRISFVGKCAPNIVLVCFGNQNMKVKEPERHIYKILSNSVKEVTRGIVRMQGICYSESRKSLQLVHTTNLQDGKLVNLARIEGDYNHIENGYGVLIPRVCNPSPRKIVLVKDRKKFVLSECVIFLRTATSEQAKEVYDSILNNWQVFEQLYTGTGAQYTTMERVKAVFPINE